MSQSKASSYVALMKLRVVELLLVTTLPALFLATYASNHAHKYPSLKITIATLIGGTLAAGAANAFNMVIEVESDRLMRRTDKRPIVKGEVSEFAATIICRSPYCYFASYFLDFYYTPCNAFDCCSYFILCLRIHHLA